MQIFQSVRRLYFFPLSLHSKKRLCDKHHRLARFHWLVDVAKQLGRVFDIIRAPYVSCSFMVVR